MCGVWSYDLHLASGFSDQAISFHNDVKLTKLSFLNQLYNIYLLNKNHFKGSLLKLLYKTNVYCASCHQFHMVTWIQKIKLISLKLTVSKKEHWWVYIDLIYLNFHFHGLPDWLWIYLIAFSTCDLILIWCIDIRFSCQMLNVFCY